MRIRIKNLRLRAIVGIHEWERLQAQTLLLNAWIDFDGHAAVESDRIEETIDYHQITEAIMTLVENSECELIERLAAHVLTLIMSDPRAQRAEVEIDKPGALRFADSVSVSCSAERQT